jgi:hypothetical protein
MIPNFEHVQNLSTSHFASRIALREIILRSLLLATSVAIADSTFAQSEPPTTGTNAAINSSADAVNPNANAPVTKPGQPLMKPGESTGSDQEAAKNASQNPLANTISVPFQNNTYYNVGPDKGTVNSLLVEPVIPIKLNSNWNLITRTIVPILRVPIVGPGSDSVLGLGNIQPQFYFSPTRPGPGRIIWGIGPQLWLPSATDSRLGINKVGGGIDGVILTGRGHLLFGALINNQWTGQNGRHERVSQFTLNPFVYYNLPKGWYVMSSPVMTADWTAKPGEKWTVPVGGGAGRIFKLGLQPVNARVQFWKDVKTATLGPSWTMQAQVQFLFIGKPRTHTNKKSQK